MGSSNQKGFVSTPANPGRSEMMIWIRDVALTWQSDECLIWPYSRNSTGYGTFGRAKKRHYAHRYICALVHGEPPTPKHHAAHSCGSGVNGCVNHRHLAWKTNRDNQLDRRVQGTATVRRNRLTVDQVIEIRKLKGVHVPAVLSKQFGVSEANIRKIHNREIWTSI
jgi:hypothetical protein